MYDAIVFSGGGTAASAFVGCILCLEHLGLRETATTFVGTSAGAILALLCVIGMTADDMRRWVDQSLCKDSIVRFGNDFDRLLYFAESLGFNDGTPFLEAIADAIESRGGLSRYVTFLELAKHTGKNLIVCTANITEGRAAYWSVDSAPNMSVLRAVRMSISIPLLYTPVVHDDGNAHVDGALFCHCPVDCILDTASSVLAMDLHIPGISSSSSSPSHPQQRQQASPRPSGSPPLDLFSYLAALTRCVLVRAHEASVLALENRMLTLKRPVKVDQIFVPLPKPLWEYFSMADMAFQLEEGFVETHVGVGYATMRDYMVSKYDVSIKS